MLKHEKKLEGEFARLELSTLNSLNTSTSQEMYSILNSNRCNIYIGGRREVDPSDYRPII